MSATLRCCILGLTAILFVATASVGEETAAKRVLLLWQGPDGHPPQTHEYRAGIRVLSTCLADLPQLKVQVVCADSPWPEGPDLIRDADGLVMYVSQGAKWIHEEPRRLEALARLAARGGGFVAMHWAIGTREADYIDGFLELLGGCHGGPDRKFKVLQSNIAVAEDHEITRGLGDFLIRDEFYYQLKFVTAPTSLVPILQAEIDGQHQTVAWAWQRGDGGRSFGFSGGHFHENWRRPEYRRLMAQAVLWTLKLPVPEAGLPVDVTDNDLALP